MNHICRLSKIPRWIRRLFGAILGILGVLLFLTPIPGGIMLSALGGMLLLCASPSLRQRMLQLSESSPRIKRRLETMLRGCQACPDKCRPNPSFGDLSRKPAEGSESAGTHACTICRTMDRTGIDHPNY